MRVLVLGSGGREHALFWKIRQSPLVERVFAAPGNGATQALFANITIDPAAPAEVLSVVHEYDINLVVIGPESVVAAGVADALMETGRLVFGPTAAAGRVETSKAYAKELMEAAGIPTAAYRVFEDRRQAREYARAHPEGLVVKADGLAAGKGVIVCDSVAATLAAIDRAMQEGVFGAAGRRVILEERLTGNEVSLMCFCDGSTAVPIPPARDYKRASDDEKGPNTGGMGAYSPPSDVDEAMTARILKECAHPLVAELARRGTPYRGCLYTQAMLTQQGPKIIEFNARFGDPEAQVVQARLSSDLVEPLLACARGDLEGVQARWDPEPAVGVVVASGGYPGQFSTGYPIEGLDSIDSDVLVFHSGTLHTTTGYVTNGGRVLTVVATGPSVAEAREKAYANVRRISFNGCFYRSDIALAETSKAPSGNLTVAAPEQATQAT